MLRALCLDVGRLALNIPASRLPLMRAVPSVLLFLFTQMVVACDRGPAPLERFAAAPADRFFRIEIAGELAGRMHEQSIRTDAGEASIVIDTVVDLPGAGRLRRRDERRFAAQPPHRLLFSRIRIERPDGTVSERDRMLDAQEPETLAEQLDQNGSAAPDEYRMGEDLLVKRTDRLPELP